MAKATKEPVVDVEIENCGNIFMFQPMTEAAKKWVGENVPTEDWQWMGGRFSVDQHYVENLANGMREAGLNIR